MQRAIRFSFIMLMALSLVCCGSKGKEALEEIRPVRAQTVQDGAEEDIRSFSGVSKAGTEANLSFRVSGVLESVAVKVGDSVQEGAPIASVDDSDAMLTYEQAKAEAINADVQLRTARATLQRVRELYENNVVALSEYESAKNDHASAQSFDETATKNAALQKRMVGYYQLRAPFSGIITTVPVTENENVTAGQTVAVLFTSGDIKVSVGLPEGIISKVNKGDAVLVRFSSFPDRQFHGIAEEVSYAVSPESSTYPVDIILQDPSTEIRPGMAAEITFAFHSGEPRHTLMVPKNAVGKDLDGTFVFTVAPGAEGLGKVAKIYVETGELTTRGFAVRKGLKQGDVIVTAGVNELRDGMTVKLLP